MTCEPLFHTIVLVTLNLNIKRRYTCCVILISEIKQFIHYHKVHSTCFICVNNISYTVESCYMWKSNRPTNIRVLKISRTK